MDKLTFVVHLQWDPVLFDVRPFTSSIDCCNKLCMDTVSLFINQIIIPGLIRICSKVTRQMFLEVSLLSFRPTVYWNIWLTYTGLFSRESIFAIFDKLTYEKYFRKFYFRAQKMDEIFVLMRKTSTQNFAGYIFGDSHRPVKIYENLTTAKITRLTVLVAP